MDTDAFRCFTVPISWLQLSCADAATADVPRHSRTTRRRVRMNGASEATSYPTGTVVYDYFKQYPDNKIIKRLATECFKRVRLPVSLQNLYRHRGTPCAYPIATGGGGGS
jgi:hypothetical protein